MLPADDRPGDGALIIDKPAGLTSHDVVAALRRALHEPKVGHVGTLDPLATGVLPVLLGRATRLAQFIAGSEKTYEARINLTGATDTDDETGTRIGNSEARPAPTRSDVESALTAFRGTIQQIPPAYSAKKVGGRRAYALARRAEPVHLAPAVVTVHHLELLEWRGGAATLLIACSAGFYVRALARDLGHVLQTGGHLSSLRRRAAGRFTLEMSVPLDDVLKDPSVARQRLLTPLTVADHLPQVTLNGEHLRRVTHGADVDLDTAAIDEPAQGKAGRVRLVTEEGQLVAIAERGERSTSLHPVVVLV